MTQTTPTETHPPPLPVVIMPGMAIVEASDGTHGTVLGVTTVFCVYRVSHTGSIAVSPWHDLALANICPARQLPTTDASENDRRNNSAAVLRELLALQQFGLSDTQQAALNELVAQLCPGSD